MLEAISYSRFSSMPQEKGESIRRQQEAFTRVCKRHGLTPSKRFKFLDAGKSGYKAVHREKGDLGRLLELVRSGEIAKGCVIVIEAWDRFGRERPDKAIICLSEILSKGIGIAVDRPDMLLYENDLASWKWNILSNMVSLAHEESKQKGERVGHARQKAREAAAKNKKIMTFRGPAWLEAGDGQWSLLPDRVEAIQEMFRLSLAGYGLAALMRKLNKGKNWKPDGGWAKSTLKKYLRDRRLLGECQPMTGRGRERKAIGDVIEGYFPVVIDTETFDAVQCAINGRIKHQRGATGKVKVANLFTGRIFDAADGSTVTAPEKTPGNRRLTSRQQSKGMSQSLPFSYDAFEKAFLGLLVHKDFSVKDNTDDSAITILENRIKEIDKTLARLGAALESAGKLETVVAKIGVLETERKQLKERLTERRQGKAMSAAATMEATRKLAAEHRDSTDDDLRRRLKTHIAAVVSEIWMLTWQVRETDPKRPTRDRGVRYAAFQVFFDGLSAMFVLNNRDSRCELVESVQGCSDLRAWRKGSKSKPQEITLASMVADDAADAAELAEIRKEKRKLKKAMKGVVS